MKLIITCEHAFPDVPEKYQHLFAEDKGVLHTHEGYDPGTFDLFEQIKDLADCTFVQEISRLLIESNRSTWHKSLYSRFSTGLSDLEKKDLLDVYYWPYRDKVQNSIASFIKDGHEVFHLSVHSFTPVLNESIRNADIGLLYDPQRRAEKELSARWKKLIAGKMPELKVRYNYPYLGKSDGFTTALRKNFKSNYLGIELEINQEWVKDNRMDPDIKQVISNTLGHLKNKA
ncbi:MAG: N-formylglutamate amidohydrolase [Gramella sp.]|nr:N-formylglutamate amidohydrolase [Christiangramia sp.]